MPSNFGEKLAGAFEERGQLCVGIDPHSHVLAGWGLPDSVAGLREFSVRMIEAAFNRASIVKPQVSFFERFGAQGYEVLSEVTQLAKSKNLLVIADAKRGDIGTTMDAYLEAWFGDLSGLHADALTTSPYLGLETTVSSMEPWLSRGKGIFSLVATSNPEGETIQKAILSNQTLAESQWMKLSALNSGARKLGNFGSVIGATLKLADFGFTQEPNHTPVLSPGFGAQGAVLEDAKHIFGSLTPQVIFSVSRSLTSFGPTGVADAIDAANKSLRLGLSQ